MNIRSKAAVLLLLQVPLLLLLSCSAASVEAPKTHEEEPETLARTEFTDRVENFFEYETLHAGKPSQVRIHLTNLSSGEPVERAEVSLTVRRKATSDTVTQTTAKIGKVTGIYVAELRIPQPGDYDLEFHIKNDKLDERLPLSG